MLAPPIGDVKIMYLFRSFNIFFTISHLPSALQPIQDVSVHKAKSTTRLRQYIGGIIVYFLNRQGGFNMRIFWEVHLTSLIQKVN